MDQFTSSTFSENVKSGGSLKHARAKSFTVLLLVSAGLVAALAAGYWLGRSQYFQTPPMSAASSAKPVPAGPVIYYRDPDGKPYYSAQPKKTSDGRDYIAVYASEDVSFEEQTAQVAAQTGKRILYYRNPMGLPDTSPVPKKDSMGMDYIPVYEGEADEGTVVKLTPGKLQRTGVRSERASRRVLTRALRAPGTVKLDERRVAVVSTRSDAFIEKVENTTTGDLVRKGQPLLWLYSSEIAAASADYLSVLSGGGNVERSLIVGGARRRLENLGIPSEVIAEIERTRKVLVVIPWSAPRDGVVLERNAVEGMKAPAGQVLFRLGDISTVWVLADVPEHELGLVRLGQPVTIRVRSLPGRTFAGEIALIYPEVSPETRTTRVRIELPNPEGVLLPEMYADVEVATGSHMPVVAVPDNAIIDSGTRQLVILDRGDGKFEPREVKVGARGEGFTEIHEGVAEGDQIVVAANFLIDAESNLKAALQALTSGDQPK